MSAGLLAAEVFHLIQSLGQASELMNPYIIPFEKLKNKDVELVGGKNASIGEMISRLAGLGVSVPGGFATTSHAYRDFLAQGGLDERIRAALASLDVDDVDEPRRGRQANPRLDARDAFSARLQRRGARGLAQDGRGPGEFAVAVRSSATAEDLPEASFAGQQETFLNVRGEEQLLTSMHEVYASLFNDRAIAYRVHNNFDHSAVALSVGVQHMVRSDLGARRRHVHARHGFGIPRRRVHHLGLRTRRDRGAGRRQSGRVLRLQAGAARRAPLDSAQESRRSKAIKMIYGEPGAGERVRTVDVPPRAIGSGSPSMTPDIVASGEAGADHRGALRRTDGYRVGQGRRHRQDLHPAGAARDGAEPRRPHHPALHAQGPLDGAGRAGAASASASAPDTRASSGT